MKSFWRGLLAWKTGVCLAFTGASVIYLIIAALMGERTVSILTLMGLLVVSVAGTAIPISVLCLPRTEGWRYSLRLGAVCPPFFATAVGLHVGVPMDSGRVSVRLADFFRPFSAGLCGDDGRV